MGNALIYAICTNEKNGNEVRIPFEPHLKEREIKKYICNRWPDYQIIEIKQYADS